MQIPVTVEMLRMAMHTRSISPTANALALNLRVPANRLSDIIRG
jgi:hypothetical protein